MVYITLPPEFEEKDVVFKLNNCIFGLSNGSRSWYLLVKEELDKVRVKFIHFEPEFFLAFQEWITRFTYYTCRWFLLGWYRKYLGHDIIQNNKYDVNLGQTKFIYQIKEIEITGDKIKTKTPRSKWKGIKKF